MTTRTAPARQRAARAGFSATTAARALLGVMAVGLVVYALYALLDVGKPAHEAFFNDVVYDGIWVLAAATMLLRAATVRATRLPWALAGLGTALAAASAVGFSLDAPNMVQDPPRLLAYPIFGAGVVLMAHAEVRGHLKHALVDAVPAALAVGGLAATILVPRIEGASAVASQATGVIAVSVLGDVLIAAFAAALFMVQSHIERSGALGLLTVAALLAGIADGAYLVQTAQGTFTPGGPSDLLWSITAFIAAAAAWTTWRRPPLGARAQPVLLLAVTAVGLAGLVSAALQDLHWAIALCAFALVAAVLRLYEWSRDEMTRARREEEALRQADRLKSALLGGFSHELLGPLTAITVAAERIPLTVSPERRAEYSQMITDEAQRVERFVRSVVDLSRAESGVLRTDARPIALLDLAQDAVATAVVEVGAMDVRVDVDPGLEVTADPVLTSRIVVNLLQNASRHGAPPVRLSAAAGMGTVELVVEDSGPGPRSARDHLFRVVPTGNASGLGVGLALSRALAEAQGGALDHVPRLGVPGRFVLTLPGGEA